MRRVVLKYMFTYVYYVNTNILCICARTSAQLHSFACTHYVQMYSYLDLYLYIYTLVCENVSTYFFIHVCPLRLQQVPCGFAALAALIVPLAWRRPQRLGGSASNPDSFATLICTYIYIHIYIYLSLSLSSPKLDRGTCTLLRVVGVFRVLGDVGMARRWAMNHRLCYFQMMRRHHDLENCCACCRQGLP